MKNLIFRISLLSFMALIISCQQVDESKMFSLLSSSKTGITFKPILKETEEFNILTYGYIYNGGGVAIGDLNNDGLQDIYFTGSMVGSRLYINKGDWEFEEIAEKAGVFAEGLWNTGVTMVDINGDGFMDIYVCRSAAKDAHKRKNLLFINNGDLTFTEKASSYGIDDSGYSTQGAFFDYDRDGDLDLYVVNHSVQEYASFSKLSNTLKQKRNPDYEDRLYRNDNGKFVDVSEKAGLTSNVLGFGLGIAISDINNDDWPDIYISNDFNEQDYLYINNQDGTFTESLEKYMGHTSHFSMGSDVADINNDGYTDIMTLDMLPEGNHRLKMVSGPDNYDKNSFLINSGFYHQSMRNMLHLNNKGKSFSEIGQFAGVSNTDWSWAALFADLDNDGYKDLYITNGVKRDYTNMDFLNYAVQKKIDENKTGVEMAITDLLENMPATLEENYSYKNNGNLTFSKVNENWGLNRKSLSNGAAYADLDNDGDLDLVVNNIDEHPFIYRNNSNIHTNNTTVKIKLNGEGMNTFGIGSKVIVKTETLEMMQEMMPTRGFQSSIDYNLIFGLGEANTIKEIIVKWPDGKTEILNNITPGKTLTLFQKNANNYNTNIQHNLDPLFTAVTSDSLLKHIHKENNFNDFKREQLLPHKLSTQGPKIGIADVNNDGFEDVFIGGAKGSAGQLFLQTNAGRFIPANQKVFEKEKNSEDIGVLFFDADNDGNIDLYVVSGGNEYENDSEELQDKIYFNDGKGNFKRNKQALPEMITSGSVAKTVDIDGDGDLDLFVGGRLVPGKYPRSPRSYILENDGKGVFKDITASINPSLEFPGMVTDALWTDYNGDGKSDLIIVGEWMAIRIFESQNGKLIETTEINGLKDSNGWWNAIIEGDFDNDGDLDYVVGNFGLNSQLKASIDEPVTLYAKDFDNNGSIDPILCSFVDGENYPVFSKDDLVGQLNMLKTKYVNYSDYASAKITDIFTREELEEADLYKANNFASSYMENLGDGNFKLSPLPASIQFAPIHGILAEDFNADGDLDLILAGNFFGTRVKYGRYDANKGNVLVGDGRGNFKPLNVLETGINMSGEVRSISKITLIDGSEILLFSRNNDSTKLYKIQSSLP
ncbi:VCBS repeat-containing protein [Arenibacter latericius]|uniref:VCBS repeat-containing protein n=1 Tax=Arenibacter latericius TaxID=86104 RepID=UPI00041543B3|nr:VCBS repeat-containing protein [Arenibacter latericius]